MSSSSEYTDQTLSFSLSQTIYHSRHLLTANFVLICLIISFIILPCSIQLSAGQGCLFIYPCKPSHTHTNTHVHPLTCNLTASPPKQTHPLTSPFYALFFVFQKILRNKEEKKSKIKHFTVTGNHRTSAIVAYNRKK